MWEPLGSLLPAISPVESGTCTRGENRPRGGTGRSFLEGAPPGDSPPGPLMRMLIAGPRLSSRPSPRDSPLLRSVPLPTCGGPLVVAFHSLPRVPRRLLVHHCFLLAAAVVFFVLHRGSGLSYPPVSHGAREPRGFTNTAARGSEYYALVHRSARLAHTGDGRETATIPFGPFVHIRADRSPVRSTRAPMPLLACRRRVVGGI